MQLLLITKKSHYLAPIIRSITWHKHTYGGEGGGGAPSASRMTRVLAWLTASTMAGTVATAFLAASDEEKRPRYMKEDVTLMGI